MSRETLATDRLAALLADRLGWSAPVDCSLGEAGPLSGEGLAKGIDRARFLDAVRRINPGPGGELWLDDAQLAQVWDAVARIDRDMVTGNEQFFELLHSGVAVDAPPWLDNGRSRAVKLVEWDDPDANDWVVATHVPIRRRSAGVPAVELDFVVLCNGIPFVVGAASGPQETDGVTGAVDRLRVLSGERRLLPDRSVPELFRYVQFLVAVDDERAALGTVTSLPEHFAEWRSTYPDTLETAAARLDLPAGQQPTTLHTLALGVLQRERLLDLVRSFSVFQWLDGRTVRLVARHQQYRAVSKTVRRLVGEQDPRARGGLLWHTQGSGKSLTMVFLIRKMRNTDGLRTFKIVVVSDRRALKTQLTPVLRLSGEMPLVAESSADARRLLTSTTPGVIQLMIQQARTDTGAGQEADDQFGGLFDSVLNNSDQILLLIDEAHRTHTGWWHARLTAALPRAVKIGLTGTPIVRSGGRTTTEIFGSEIDRYTLREAEQDGATVPIRYEGRYVSSSLVDRAGLDAAYQLDAADEVPLNVRHVLESTDLIRAKARDMLAHWVEHVLPAGFKAQVVAVSRLAAVRYRDAFLTARDGLVRAAEKHLASPGPHDGYDEGLLAAAARHLYPLRQLDFIPVISPSAGDPPEFRPWTERSAHDTHIARYLQPLPRPVAGERGDDAEEPWSPSAPLEPPPVDPNEGPDGPWDGCFGGLEPDTAFSGRPREETPVGFLIVQRMLLTGFDAPLQQALYVDRPIRGAELLQAVARTNRPARNKPYGLVVDYVALADHLDEALAEYELDDLEGMREDLLGYELPRLAAHAQTMRGTLAELGISESEARDPDAQEELLARLEDPALRARFDGAARAFLSAVERLLPRREVGAHLELAKDVGLLQWRVRRRFRDTGTGRPDPNQYGPLLRELLDEHIRANVRVQEVPPVEITGASFRDRVDALRSDRARAREYEYALRRLIEESRRSDPGRIGRLSGQLDLLLTQLDQQWRELADALGDLVDQIVVDDAEILALDLDPQTEGRIFSVLEEQLAAEISAQGPITRDRLVEVARRLAVDIRDQIGPPHFPGNEHLQQNLRRNLRRQVIDLLDVSRDVAGPIAGELLGLAVEQRDQFLRE
ncbi:type I restriction endonuclease subunit R [Actinomadura bangladeshensis]|uniref:type I site-specific deoxyribonuclease n=1 Tax=Actinomadura bangladeshensis TaxID=453573 RepID=A0A4R4NCG0_9ACTN|nr:type I restriction endonuclease [Actinomadura bangladeshensis]TDC06761.1 type I restriction endonuclease subunit R [Actinomadura bangladeshensis]